MRGAWIALAISAISLAHAQPPHVSLHVEQPAYAGMPVWLDVDVDDPCITPEYFGAPGGSADNGSAQVIGPDGTPRHVRLSQI
jgi:hypothetical protein